MLRGLRVLRGFAVEVVEEVEGLRR